MMSRLGLIAIVCGLWWATGTARWGANCHPSMVCGADVGLSASLEAASCGEKSSNIGSVSGRVVYQADPQRPWRFGRYYIADKKTGALAEGVVCLSSRELRTWPANAKPRKWKVDQKDHRFVPETVAIRAGDEVKFTNSDLQLHNVSSNSNTATIDFSVRPGGELSHTFSRAGDARQPVTLGCKLHSAMRGWIYVFAHPFFQVTEANGEFSLADVSAGEYRLEFQHPAGGLAWRKMITVKAGEPVKMEIVVRPDDIVRD